MFLYQFTQGVFSWCFLKSGKPIYYRVCEWELRLLQFRKNGVSQTCVEELVNDEWLMNENRNK